MQGDGSFDSHGQGDPVEEMVTHSMSCLRKSHIEDRGQAIVHVVVELDTA